MSPAAGDTERSAATSPRSEGGRGRLQEKAQRLAAELDLKLLSVSKRTAGLQGERALSLRQASPFLAGVERRDASPARILQVTPNSPGLARSDASPVRIVQASPTSGRGRQDASPRIAQASRTAGQREALPPARILQESSPRRVRIAQEPAKTVGSGNLASLRSENQAGLEEKLEALRGELVEERRSRQAAEAALAEKLHEKLAQLDGLGQAVRQLEALVPQGTHVESSLAKDLTQVGGETSALRAAVEVLQTKLAAAEEGTAEMQAALSDLRLRLLGCEAASSALKVNLGDLQAAAPAGQERLDVDRSDLWRVAQEAQAGQERLRQECAALETRLGQAISQQAERSWENLEAAEGSAPLLLQKPPPARERSALPVLRGQTRDGEWPPG
ncbi:unnamed protein product [Effrenium voratum]|uniref:Uncharacterized protein n=1 Tax=Effrenium voratum TaxID=2562239 RepID=A0AA36IYY0_9DINO|nr:unnamed protein product [Effrenium voratum]